MTVKNFHLEQALVWILPEKKEQLFYYFTHSDKNHPLG